MHEIYIIMAIHVTKLHNNLHRVYISNANHEILAVKYGNIKSCSMTV